METATDAHRARQREAGDLLLAEWRSRRGGHMPINAYGWALLRVALRREQGDDSRSALWCRRSRRKAALRLRRKPGGSR